MPNDPQLKNQIRREYIKCAQDPEYFIRNYVYIQHQALGRILFDMYDFQERSLQEILDHQFNVILKARQMGISTLVAAYALWLMTFNNGKQISVVSMKRDTAKNIINMVKFAHRNLPVWMREKRIEDNKLSLALENDSKIFAESTTSDAGRSGSYSLMIIDEAAFIRNAEELWSSAKLTLDVGGGKAIVLSTPKDVGSWFHQTWSEAVAGAQKIEDDPERWRGTGKNEFHPIKLHWSLHPERDSEWRREQDRILGPTKAARECDCDFETSGDSVIDPKLLNQYEEQLICEPIERRMVRGSADLWVWEEPEPNVQYILSADVSRGDSDDYSAFHILSAQSIEQKVEYKGKIPPEIFANLIYTQASYYNDALVVVERNNYGYSVLQELIKRGYPNILYTSNDMSLVDVRNRSNKFNKARKKMKPGLDTNRKTRPLIISKLNEYFRNKYCKVYSSRLIEELRTFVWKGQKAEHMDGFNDDLVLAIAFGFWVRDTALRFESELSKMTKQTLTGFSTGKGVYTPNSNMNDPYTVEHQGNKHDIRWLL